MAGLPCRRDIVVLKWKLVASRWWSAQCSGDVVAVVVTRVEMVCHRVCQWCHSASESVGILVMIPPIRGDVALPPRRRSIKRGATCSVIVS